jgi:NAD(P)-dependent dehydrogenase (short-subunit alcohol dehydrogenase family)
MSVPAQRLAGKRVLMTAAGSGIGRASAELFAEHGAAIAVADIDAAKAAETVAAIVAAGGRAVAIEADVSKEAAVRAMVDRARLELGGIDVLFNNAGIGKRGKAHELEEADWDRIMDVTLKSVFLCSKAVVPHFLAQGHGAIVNTASTYGLLVAPSFVTYCTAKAGVIMLTKAMALDYGPTIRVNCICPGVTNTPVIQGNIARASDKAAELERLESLNRALHRIAEPREIAHTALFLASDDASFVTGAALVVDGGQTIDA